MKRFKTAKQLNEEKKRLKMRRAELEKAIRYDWRDVKESLRPGNIAGQVFADFSGQKESGPHNESGVLSEMAARFASKLASKAGEKLKDKAGKWFKK